MSSNDLDGMRDVIREKYYSIRSEQQELIVWNSIYYSIENVTQNIWEWILLLYDEQRGYLKKGIWRNS